MKAITLRHIPPELAAFIEAEAARTGASLNATAIRLLQLATNAAGEASPRKRRDLSSFAGTWTKEEADEFDRFLAEHRKIEPELWR
jgi:hypothetical protein